MGRIESVIGTENMNKKFFLENGFVKLSEIGYELGLDRGATNFLREKGHINVVSFKKTYYVQEREIKQFTKYRVDKMRNKPGYVYDSDLNDLFNSSIFQNEKAVAFCEMVKQNKSVKEIMEELTIPMRSMWLVIKKIKYLKGC